MPNQATATSARHRGWYYDQVNQRIAAVFNGTEVFDFDANDMALAQALSSTTTYTSTGTGNMFIAATGNVAIGNPGTYGTTQPQGAVTMGGSSLSGIAPVGAITTAGGIFASDTVVRKILAAGTASNVET